MSCAPCVTATISTAWQPRYDGAVRIRTTIAALAVGVAICGGSARAVLQAEYGVDLNGKALSSLSAPGTAVVVLFFLATDCPVSNRYQPEISRLGREFAGKHVSMWIVYPNPAETASEVRSHQQQYGQGVPALLDPGQALARLAGARMTPEAAVFRVGPEGLREVYRGRIDDRYLSLGQQRPQATRRELEEAIRAALAGTAVRPAGGGAVGCAIVRVQ